MKKQLSSGGRMKREPVKPSKLQATPTTIHGRDANETVEGVIKVLKDAYVPPGVTVRARIDPRMMTATFKAGTIADLDKDPNVESVALSRRLRVIDEERGASGESAAGDSKVRS